MWAALLHAVDRGDGIVQESVFDCDIGVQQKQPLPLAESTTAIYGLRESVIAIEPADCDAAETLQPANHGMKRGVIVNDDDFGEAGSDSEGATELAGEAGGVPPLAEID